MAKTKKKVAKSTHPHGSEAYRRYMERKERERAKRGFIRRSRKQRSASGLAGGKGSAGPRKVRKRAAK